MSEKKELHSPYSAWAFDHLMPGVSEEALVGVALGNTIENVGMAICARLDRIIEMLEVDDEQDS